MPSSQMIQLDQGINRIMLFDEVYPFLAAKEQAEKKKLSAFGMLAKLNPLNRPKQDTVHLTRHEMRLEPFWHIGAKRIVDYSRHVAYPVAVHDPYAQAVTIDNRRIEVAYHGDKGRFELQGSELCHRKISYIKFIDGLNREKIPQPVFANYLVKYKYTEQARIERTEMLKPLGSLAAATQLAQAGLNREAINADEIETGLIEFEHLHLFIRPVFAFAFTWSTAQKTGVIEVDGLTGEVLENGHWLKDKLDQILTREMLVDVSCKVANSLLPGGGIAVKIVNKMVS